MISEERSVLDARQRISVVKTPSEETVLRSTLGVPVAFLLYPSSFRKAIFSWEQSLLLVYCTYLKNGKTIENLQHISIDNQI